MNLRIGAGAIAFIAVAFLVRTARADIISYNFTNPAGPLGTSQSYTDNGVTITAYGFTSAGVPYNLYGKTNTSEGLDELGLGLNDGVHFEVEAQHFIELDLANIMALDPTALTIGLGSVQEGEGGNVYGSNTYDTLGTFLFTIGDENLHSLPTSGYEYFNIKASGGNVYTNDVLITSLGASYTPTPAVPEPVEYPMLVIAGSLMAISAKFRKLKRQK